MTTIMEQIKSAITVQQFEHVMSVIRQEQDETTRNALLAAIRYEALKVAASGSPRAVSIAKAVL